MKELPAIVRRLVDRFGGQEELAKEIGTSQPTISRLCKGGRPEWDTVQKFRSRFPDLSEEIRKAAEHDLAIARPSKPAARAEDELSAVIARISDPVERRDVAKLIEVVVKYGIAPSAMLARAYLDGINSRSSPSNSGRDGGLAG